jgi:RNA polymerase sigma factor (TIGR02999 family)
MAASQPEITPLLDLASRGDRQAQDDLYRLVEAELRRRARSYLRRESPTPELQTTVLVDEAFVQLVGSSGSWESRAQFYCSAARAMRHIIVDAARKRAAARRGGGERPLPLEAVPEPAAPRGMDVATLVALHEALTRLGETHPELEQVVNLHHFGGCELKQIADDILHLPYAKVKRQWERARALLYREMNRGDDDP